MEEAGEYDITIEQGSGFSLPITYEAPEGTVVDLTGSTARLQARKTYGATDKLFELTTENGGIALGGVAGTIHLSMTAVAVATAALTFSRGVYDLEIVPCLSAAGISFSGHPSPGRELGLPHGRLTEYE